MSGRAATPAAAKPATATFVDAERGATTAVTHTSAAATALNSPDRPGAVCRAKSTAVCTPRRDDRNRRGLRGSHTEPEQLGDQPDRAGDRQRAGGAADQLTAVAVDVEHRHRGQAERDDRRAVGHRAHQRRRQRVLLAGQRPRHHCGDRDDQGSTGHRPLTGHLCRRTAQTAPPATIRPAATKNGHTGIPSFDGPVADADGPGVPVPATVEPERP